MYHAHCYLRMLHTVAEKTYTYMYKVEAGGVVADHSKGQDTRQSTIAIQTEVDEDAITVSWQVPRHNDVGGAHILHRHQFHPVLGEGGGRG